DDFALWRSDQPVADVLDTEGFEHLRDSHMNFAGREIRPQLSRVKERFTHSELGMQDIVLRHVSNLEPELVLVCVQVFPIEKNPTGRRWSISIKGFHQCSLAGACQSH